MLFNGDRFNAFSLIFFHLARVKAVLEKHVFFVWCFCPVPGSPKGQSSKVEKKFTRLEIVTLLILTDVSV